MFCVTYLKFNDADKAYKNKGKKKPAAIKAAKAKTKAMIAEFKAKGYM